MTNVQEKLTELNEAYVNCQLLVEKHKRFIKDLRDQLKDLIAQIEGVKDATGHDQQQAHRTCDSS